ncbi:MAG: hypothetical protein KDH84_06130, partial [Calditrichaeota bacterium]|nr:hypothetical protein [Calditrichota bacterium]
MGAFSRYKCKKSCKYYSQTERILIASPRLSPYVYSTDYLPENRVSLTRGVFRNILALKNGQAVKNRCGDGSYIRPGKWNILFDIGEMQTWMYISWYEDENAPIDLNHPTSTIQHLTPTTNNQ